MRGPATGTASRWTRHTEGWQVGVLLVSAGLLAFLLAAPRPSLPGDLPLPSVDRAQERETLRALRRRALAALREALPFDARAVGEGIRRYGLAALEGDARAAADAKRVMAQHLRLCRAAHGDEPVLRLRALQTRLFVQAVRQWRATGEPNEDLRELGGDFLRDARSRGWLDRRGRLTLDEAELVALFMTRWTALVGLKHIAPFALTLNEWRAYYRVHLRHLPAEGGDPASATSTASQSRSEFISALSRVDAEYPSALARGILRFRAGRYAEAARLFDLHLQQSPEGPWALRARGFLAGAVAARAAVGD